MSKRLKKELQQLLLEPPAGVHISENTANNLGIWSINVDGAPNTLYAGEKFTLRVRNLTFKFS